MCFFFGFLAQRLLYTTSQIVIVLTVHVLSEATYPPGAQSSSPVFSVVIFTPLNNDQIKVTLKSRPTIQMK